MSNSKLFFYLGISLILIINTYLLYLIGLNFWEILEVEPEILLKMILTMVTLMIAVIFLIASYASTKRSAKKTLLRLTMLLTLILTVLSIYARAVEGYWSEFFWWKLINTIGFFILFAISVSVSYDLYDKLYEQYEETLDEE